VGCVLDDVVIMRGRHPDGTTAAEALIARRAWTDLLGSGWSGRPEAATWTLLRLGLAAAATAVLMLAGAVLVFRQLAGALGAPAPAIVLAAGLVAIALVKVVDAALVSGGPSAMPLVARAGLIAAVGALALTPRSSASGESVARAVVVAAAAVAVSGLQWRLRPRTRPRVGTVRPTRRRPSGRRRPTGTLRQRFQRIERPDGTDAIHATLVVAIPAGSRTGQGHVGFCPSFSAMPTVELTSRYDGVDVMVSVAELLPWGLRVECRLADPAEEPVEVPVMISASVPPATASLP